MRCPVASLPACLDLSNRALPCNVRPRLPCHFEPSISSLSPPAMSCHASPHLDLHRLPRFVTPYRTMTVVVANCHACLAEQYLAASHHAVGCRVSPALPCRIEPDRAKSCRACLALSNLADPAERRLAELRRGLPAWPYPALPYCVQSSHACLVHDSPCVTGSRRPCHMMPAFPGQSGTRLAPTSLPSPVGPYHIQRSNDTPGLPSFGGAYPLKGGFSSKLCTSKVPKPNPVLLRESGRPSPKPTCRPTRLSKLSTSSVANWSPSKVILGSMYH